MFKESAINVYCLWTDRIPWVDQRYPWKSVTLRLKLTSKISAYMISKAFSFCKSSPSFSSLFCKWIWWTKTGLKIWRIREGFYSKKHPFRTEKSLIQKIQKHLNLNFERVFKIKSYWLLDFFETKKSPEIIGTWCGSWGIRTPDPLLVRKKSPISRFS